MARKRALFTRQHYRLVMLAFAVTKPNPEELPIHYDVWTVIREAMIAVLKTDNSEFFSSTFRRGCDGDPASFEVDPVAITAAQEVMRDVKQRRMSG